MARPQVKSHVMNMTEGNPTGLLIRFAIPMLIGNLFQQVYNLVDSIIVGRFVGAEALAAVGATSSTTFLFFALCNGIGNGGGIVTSQCFGTGDEDKVKSCIVNTAYLMLAMSIVVGGFALLLSKPLLLVLDTPADILSDSLIYLRYQCIGIIFVAIYNYAASMLRALGDSKTPLYFLIFSCLLNTGLDLFFVCSLGMGVAGAAFATVVSQLISGAACLVFAFKTNEYFKLDRSHMQPNKEMMSRALKLGIPLSMQFALISISCMVLQRVVNGFGAVAVAAFTATSRIEQVIHQPYQTLGQSLSTFCGQNYGARKNDRVVLGLKKGIMLMVIFSLIMLPVMQIFCKQIIMIFVEDQAVIDMGAQALRITSLFYVFLGVIYVVRGVLNGVGDSVFAFINGIVEVICRCTFPAFMTGLPIMGLWGIWWSVGVTWFIAGLTAYLRYKWYKRRLFEDGEAESKTWTKRAAYSRSA
ncbi:MAG: MATE family efflux transporter [Lachnospiraceae bacterium]|nr:MATE family efflux transporter [Lachnospiraceae bacterium]